MNTKISNIMLIIIILCICLSNILEAKPITDASPLLCGRIQTYSSISAIGANNVDGQNIHEVVTHDMQLYHGDDIYYTCQPVSDDHFDSWGG